MQDNALHLRRASELGLVVGDGLDLGGRATLRIETVVEPVEGKLLGEFDANDTLTHTEDLSIVAQDGTLDGERVVSSDGSDTGNLVGGDSDTQTGTTDEEATVSLTGLDLLSTLDGGVRVGGLIGGIVDTDVRDGGDKGALLENGLDGILVGDTGLVTGHDNTERLSRHDEGWLSDKMVGL